MKMEKVENPVKTEPNEALILPDLESGTDGENIISTIKKEDEGFEEALFNVAKEENPLVKSETETKPSVLTHLVKSCSVILKSIDENYLDSKRIIVAKEDQKIKLFGAESISCVTDNSGVADSAEESVEDSYLEHHDDSDRSDVDFNHLVQSHNPEHSRPHHLNLARFKKVYVKDRKFVCMCCDKRFPQSDILRRHIRIHTGEKPYECFFCCMRFRTKSLMKRHSVIHTGKSFCCSVCNKRFAGSQGLKSHMLIHEGKKPFQCGECSSSFRQKISLTRHIGRMHLPVKNKEFDVDSPKLPNGEQTRENHKDSVFQCAECGKFYRQKKGLLGHINHSHSKNNHEGKRSFHCGDCSSSFQDKKSLIKHIRRMHQPVKDSIFKCDDCGNIYRRKERLLAHIYNCHTKNTQDGKRPFQCTECCSSFWREQSLNVHFVRMHLPVKNKYIEIDRQKLPDAEQALENDKDKFFDSRLFIPTDEQTQANNEKCKNIFQCNECANTYRYVESLLAHINKFHSEYNYICDQCGKVFKSRQNISVHMMTIHMGGYKALYSCRICGLGCTTTYNLKKHERLHEEVYPYKCTHCNCSFKAKGNLRSHLKNVHESEKSFRCADCGQSFKGKANLSAHIEVHHIKTDLRFSCHICKMEFKRDTYLKRHVQTHTDADKNFECDNCGLRCRSKTDIAKHVLTHLGAVEKRFMCDECGERFSKHSHVVRHKRVHSDVKPFPCELCDKAYKDTSSLKIHHETVHTGASFSCQGCGFSSTNRHSFNRHLRSCQS